MTLVTLVHPWYMFGASPMSHIQCPICLGRGVFGVRGLAIKDHLFPLQVRSSHALKHLARLVGLLRGRHPKGHISALASGLVGPSWTLLKGFAPTMVKIRSIRMIFQ